MEKYELFVCKICGDPYLGTGAPSRCPFCGAYEENVVPVEQWGPVWGKPISEISRKHLEEALQLEIGATNFYRNVSKASEDVWAQKMFKAVMKSEREHASAIVKILGVEMPDIEKLDREEDKTRGSIEENLAEFRKREEDAVEAYKMSAEESTDEPVKYFFRELVKIESDHILLTE